MKYLKLFELHQDTTEDYRLKKAFELSKKYTRTISEWGRPKKVEPFYDYKAFMDIDLNDLLQTAYENNHEDIVQLLIGDKSIDPELRKELVDGFVKKCQYDDIEGVEEELKKGIDPSEDDNIAIRLAAKNDNVQIVNLLMRDPRVDPSAKKDNAFRWASHNSSIRMMKQLLKDERVDPSTNFNKAIKTAFIQKNGKIVRFLAKDPRVQEEAGMTEKELIEKYSI